MFWYNDHKDMYALTETRIVSCYNVLVSDSNMIIGSRFHPKPPPEDKNCIEFILERPCRLYPNRYAVVSESTCHKHQFTLEFIWKPYTLDLFMQFRAYIGIVKQWFMQNMGWSDNLLLHSLLKVVPKVYFQTLLLAMIFVSKITIVI